MVPAMTIMYVAFQSTCPHGARPQHIVLCCYAAGQFQSTCPHGARQDLKGKSLWATRISIHVPARGTTLLPSKIIRVRIFQSTCPHGARLSGPAGLTGVIRFQSTCPHGARLATNLANAPLYPISIHVPARGTTRVLAPDKHLVINFNPRARTGHDYLAGLLRSGDRYFNPRARTGHDKEQP